MYEKDRTVEEFAVGQMIPQQIGYGQNTQSDNDDFKEINDAIVEDIMRFGRSASGRF